MMRLTWRDGMATLIVAAVAIVYLALLADGSVGFIQDPRSMAVIGLLSALVLCPLSGLKVFDAWAGGISVVGAMTLGLGLVTVFANAWAPLALFIAAIVLMWALSTLHHMLGAVQGPMTRGHAAGA